MIRIVWNNLIPPGYAQQDIIDFLLTPAIFHNPDLESKINSSSFYWREKKGKDEKIDFPTDIKVNKSSRTRLFSYQPESRRITERMMALLLLKTKHENIPYTMSTFPARHVFKKQWQLILSPVSEEQKNTLTADKSGTYYTSDNRRLLSGDEVLSFKKYIQLLCKKNSTPEDFNSCISEWKYSKISRQVDDVCVTFKYKGQEIKLEDLLNSIPAYDYSTSPYSDDSFVSSLSDKDNLFYERLSTISVIACVWYIWEKAKDNPIYAKQIVSLAKMIFPIKLIQQLVPEDADTDTIKHTAQYSENEDTQNAERDLVQAKAYMASKQYQEAGVLCENIFETYKHASDYAIGTALAHLVECCENGYKKPSKFTSIDDIKKEAINYQCIYISKKRHNIKSSPKRSDIASTGLFTLNCESLISTQIIETAPKSWDATISSTPATTITPGRSQRIILINDDYNINIQDTLDILDCIKKSINSKKTAISDWSNVELYIRCNEDETTPLLDTALSYFTENTAQGFVDVLPMIKIYLIDEAKRSADYLFAKHPHFYPLTFARSEADEKKTIHLVIVSNNPEHSYAKWLIKEGFWTLPRFDKNISTKITVISPYASEIGYSIISKCQGLEGFSIIDKKRAGEPIEIDDINFPLIEYKQTAFTNRSLHNELKKTFCSEDYLYYVIDADSDLNGIQLGTTIRELSIRKAVTSGRVNSYSKKNYIIAIRCQNPDYAALTQELIIPKEKERANQWFNDYNFITWGSMEYLYSWDQLNGGIIETLAQCIHLQYCNSSFEKEDCKKHLASYFRRLYNHDSSFAAAVSLPYRLFESGVVPQAWFIQNPDAWWNKSIREELAKNYRQKLYPVTGQHPDKLLIEHLAQYEHMRWCCYQLTRGWLPVSDEQQVIQYMKAGVTRHSLQIAKLHPCICSWKHLRSLHKMLNDAATHGISDEDYKNFCSIRSESPKEFEDKIKPYLNKKFKEFFSPDDDYSKFQRIDNKNIEQTADILETKWNPDKIYDPDEKVK